MAHRSHARIALAWSLSLVAAGVASAHDPGPRTEYLRWPFPDPDGLGGAGFATFIGPEAGNEITHARMHIVFVTDTPVNPEEVGVSLSTQVDGTFRDWDVHLVDLGISGEPGTYVADIETDGLNGIVWEFDGWPHSLMDFSWFTGGEYPNTYFAADSWFEVQYEPIPGPMPAALFAGAGLRLGARPRRTAAPRHSGSARRAWRPFRGSGSALLHSPHFPVGE